MWSLLINTAHAASAVDDLVGKIKTNILNPIIAIMFGLAFVIFLYGVVEFIQGGANEKSIETGKRHMIYGILGLVIMLGVNGIIAQIISFVGAI